MTTKKQHYVPQFYLRQWCDTDGGFYPIKIEAHTPPKLRVFKNKSNPVRFCYENFFYAQHTGQGDDLSQRIEKAFAEIEGIFNSEIPKIERKILNNEQITEADKYHLSEFMVFLWIKGKAHRQHSQDMMDRFIKQVNKRTMPYMDRDPKMKAIMDEKGITKEALIEFVEKEKYTVDMGNMFHLALLQDMPGFCNLLSGKYWRIYLSRDGKFITTDAPYLDKALSKHFLGNDFLSREQSFVLSPRVLIVTCYPNAVIGKKIGRKDITNNMGIIHQINAHNLMQSIRFGFHMNRDLLDELQKTVDFLYLNKDKLKLDQV